MPILVKVSPTCPTFRSNDIPSMEIGTVSPGHCLVRQQLTQGSFGLFSLCLNLKICRFDPKSSDFIQFKPRNIIKDYLSQIIKSKVRKSEARKEKEASL